MGEVKQINIKNRSYYFYNDIIDLKNFDARLLKIEHWHLQQWVYHKKKIDNCKNINSVNPWYLSIDHANGYIEEKNGIKYLIFDSVDENKELLKNTMMFGVELRIKSKK